MVNRKAFQSILQITIPNLINYMLCMLIHRKMLGDQTMEGFQIKINLYLEFPINQAL